MNGAECPMFVKLSTFAELSDMAKEAIVSILDQISLKAICRSLAPLAAGMPEYPLAFLGKLDAVLGQNTRFPELLREFYNRGSRAAVVSSKLG